MEILDLPEGVETLGKNAFYICSGLKTVVFPSTLSFLGIGSCARWDNIEGIYCKSVVPPTCEIDGENNPFKNDRALTSRSVSVYVPMGTAEAYKAAPGWNYFNNYVELAPEDFPASVDEVAAETSEGDGKVYDLSGRRVVNQVSGQVYIKDGKKFVGK